MLHSDEVPVTDSVELPSLEYENDMCVSDKNHGHIKDTDFVDPLAKESDHFNQGEFNDLDRDLGLSKEL